MKKFGSSILALLVLFLMGSCTSTKSSPGSGQDLAVTKGCAACHAVDDTPRIGPSWVGLYESQVELTDGSSVTADETYLIDSTIDPNAKIVNGYSEGSMPAISLTDEELNAIVAYIKSVK